MTLQLASDEAHGADVEHLYQRISCPTMLTFATDEPGGFGFAPELPRPALLEHLRHLRPEWNHTLVPGGHNMHFDNTADASAIVLNLWSQLNPRYVSQDERDGVDVDVPDTAE
jgi:hypothetical protein